MSNVNIDRHPNNLSSNKTNYYEIMKRKGDLETSQNVIPLLQNNETTKQRFRIYTLLFLKKS